VYEVQLVDDVRVLRDGGALGAIDGRPARLLLVWLALHPGRQPRNHVAAQIWPDVHPDSARTSLRAALASLRRSLGEDARTAFRTQQHQASRWTYLGSGMTHPQFRATLGAITPAGRDRIDAIAPAFA